MTPAEPAGLLAPAFGPPEAGASPASVSESTPSDWRPYWRLLRTNSLTMAGTVLSILMFATAIVVYLAPVVTHLLLHRALSVLPYGPNQLTEALHQSPSWAHPFGTDELGRDLFSRVLAALPLDLGVSALIAGSALVLGGTLGLVVGYYEDRKGIWRAASVAVLRVVDIFLSLPALVLALALVASLGRGLIPAIIALQVVWWPYYVRLTRGETLGVRRNIFITAAEASGVSDGQVIRRHVLPNVLPALLVYFTLDLGSVIVTFSSISFLQVGPPPSIPELGSMVYLYEPLLLQYPWTVLAPGLAIVAIVTVLSLLGEGLRDLTDPRRLTSA